MKKTTIQIQWDNAQYLNRLASHISEERGIKITQDQAIRYLIDFYEKSSHNAFKTQKGGNLK